jgi:hypothetical protein
MALVLCASTLLAAPAFAQSDEQVIYPACREVRNLDAMQYWFWEGYFGFVDVHDFTHERWGRLGLEPSVCFRIALVVVDNPQLKSAGYRQAVSELLLWVTEDDSDPDESAKLAIKQLERLTGEDFDTGVEWTEWWEVSHDFVLWSEDEERLLVVTEAQAAGETVHADARTLEPEEYWFYAGRGWLTESEPVGGFVFGSVLVPPHDFNYRVLSARLQDREAKENGYRRALDNLFVDGLLLPGLQGDSLDTVIDQISSLTGESYDDRDSWVAWWDLNRERLVLSPTGDRLVIRR